MGLVQWVWNLAAHLDKFKKYWCLDSNPRGFDIIGQGFGPSVSIFNKPPSFNVHNDDPELLVGSDSVGA